MSEVAKVRAKRCPGGLLLLGTGLIAGVLIASASLAGYSRHHWRDGKLPQEHVLKRMTRGTEWVLRRVDATDEQRARINAILANLAPDIIRLQNEQRHLVNRFIRAVEADEVSPEELARLQAAGLILAEQALQRTTDVVLWMSQVLTPAQRKGLVRTWRQWR